MIIVRKATRFIQKSLLLCLFYISEGGIPGKLKGRISDAPLVGCGGYANKHGAATACGHGEAIMKMTLAREVVHNMEMGQNAEVTF